MEIELRAATPDDLPAIRALMHGERVNPFGIDWRNFVVAADRAGLAGCVQLRPARPAGLELGTLIVRPDLRRRGLGTRLVAAALERAGPLAVFAVTATSSAGFLGRFGFRTVGHRSAPASVRRNRLLGQAGSLVTLATGRRPRRLAILCRAAP